MGWKDGLHKKAAHAALGLPTDEMISVSNKSGLDWKMAAVLAAAGLGGYHLYNQNSNQQTATPSAPAPVSPVDSEYEVRFYDADGNPIQVPHISKLGAGKE